MREPSHSCPNLGNDNEGHIVPPAPVTNDTASCFPCPPFMQTGLHTSPLQSGQHYQAHLVSDDEGAALVSDVAQCHFQRTALEVHLHASTRVWGNGGGGVGQAPVLNPPSL